MTALSKAFGVPWEVMLRELAVQNNSVLPAPVPKCFTYFSLFHPLHSFQNIIQIIGRALIKMQISTFCPPGILSDDESSCVAAWKFPFYKNSSWFSWGWYTWRNTGGQHWLNFIQTGQVSPTATIPQLANLQRGGLNPNPSGFKACMLFIRLKVPSLCTCFQNFSSLMSQISLHMFFQSDFIKNKTDLF